MHYRRQVDNLLDQIIEENNKLNNKEETELSKSLIKAELQEIKDQINTLTNDGERARGLWTDSPEFICKNIFNN
tara:strand:- start:299 stop:520 length:222 start_codon:yes stop_codon:yes gene_type:complete